MIDPTRIRSNADEADRLADIVQRRLIDSGDVAILQGTLGLMVAIRSHLKEILELANGGSTCEKHY